MECSCDAGYIDDYSGPSLFNEKTRIARKQHRCCECKRVIEPKEHYSHVSGKWDGDFREYKTCQDCESMREEFFSSGYVFGSLWDDFYEYVNGCQGDIPENCILQVTLPARIKIAEQIQDIIGFYDDDEEE